MVTVRDVAKMAGVSPGTVSNVLTGNASVKDDTKDKVMQAIKDLNYSPNEIAKSLSTRKSFNIGLVIPSNVRSSETDPVYSTSIKCMAVEAAAHDYHFMVYADLKKEDDDMIYDKLCRNRRLDGLILLEPYVNDKRIAILKKHRFPFLVIGRSTPDVLSVDLDNVRAAYLGARHLISLGHKRIGFINGPEDKTVSLDRFEGYKRALTDCNIDYDESLVKWGEFTRSSGYEYASDIVSSDKSVTAIFAGYDLVAIGAMEAMEELGLDVPGDIAMASIGDLYTSSLVRPKLTVIDHLTKEISISAVQKLILLLSGDTNVRSSLLEAKMVIRDSCGYMGKAPKNKGVG